MTVRSMAFVGVVTMLVLTCARPALAGPPFLCHAFDIGTARSLPWDGRDFWQGRNDYDVRNLVADTQALLTPATPVIVRMETLRRATLYAAQDRKVATRLLAAIIDRARTLESEGRPDGLAWFDAAYVAESFKEAAELAYYKIPELGQRAAELKDLQVTDDPQALMQRALALRPDDASIEFAVALMSPSSLKPEHARKARAGAERDALLAQNLKHL